MDKAKPSDSAGPRRYARMVFAPLRAAVRSRLFEPNSQHSRVIIMNEPRAGEPIGERSEPAGALPLIQLRDSFEFLRGFARNPSQVGSLVPSSRYLEQRLVREARLSRARTAVELGPGTGGTTAAFLQAMAPNARLLAVELDGDFHDYVRAAVDDPRLALECGSAERLPEFLAKHHLPAPDAIISGIPFSTMPREVSDRIAAAIAQVLRPGGRFVAYQVRAHVASFVTPYLGAPETQWEVVNVPPMRVFTWIKRSSDLRRSATA